MTHTQHFARLCAELNRQHISCETDAPLAMLTTFRIGGRAALLCSPENEQQLCDTVRLARQESLRFYLLGCGSNTLFADGGFDGVVILTNKLDTLEVTDSTCMAAAGVPLSKLCLAVQQKGLTGLQFAYGIPGSVGGGVYMNAGAYGGEMKNVVCSVRVLTPLGEIKEYSAEECDFRYRHSRFEDSDEVILSASFRLEKGDADQILVQMKEIFARRKEKQPLEWPSAGSTFKRPEGAFAAALIEQCGLKGFSIGGAQVSEKHSGFVINKGGASCAEVVALTQEIVRVVKEQTGFTLEREIRIVR